MTKPTTARAVSFQGDEYDVAAVNQLAKEHGVRTGVFVATSLRQLYGKDLERLASFFRKRGSSTSQLDDVEVGEAEHA